MPQVSSRERVLTRHDRATRDGQVPSRRPVVSSRCACGRGGEGTKEEDEATAEVDPVGGAALRSAMFLRTRLS